MRAGGIALALVLALARSAHADPSDETLVLVGAAMALPTYAVGVTLHESTHALAAKLVGADVDELHVFPPGLDPHVHVFRFGWTYVHGLGTRRAKEFFYLAPKITDAVLLGGFAALAFSHAWPANKYGQLALTVGATGLWVDFSKDVVVTAPTDDVTRAFDLWCLAGWRRVAARVAYAAADAGLALIVARGYERTFTSDPAIVPLVRTAF